jgi:hypothetical protein
VPLPLTIPSTLIFAYGEAFMLAVILAIFYLLDTQLGYLYGDADVSCWSIGAALVTGFREGNILNVLVIPYLVAPIGDVAETVFALVHRFIKPHWIQRPLPFPTKTRDDEWKIAELRAVRSATSLLWLVYSAWALNIITPEEERTIVDHRPLDASSTLRSRAAVVLLASAVMVLGHRVHLALRSGSSRAKKEGSTQ